MDLSVFRFTVNPDNHERVYLTFHKILQNVCEDNITLDVFDLTFNEVDISNYQQLKPKFLKY